MTWVQIGEIEGARAIGLLNLCLMRSVVDQRNGSIRKGGTRGVGDVAQNIRSRVLCVGGKGRARQKDHRDELQENL